MSSPLRQRLILALSCLPPGTQTRLHSCGQILGSRPAALTDLLTALAATLGRRQLRNVPPLHTAQAVHEVVTKEYHILDTLNHEVTTFTSSDWVRLFETRSSMNVEHLQALPTGNRLTALTARARPFRDTRKHGPASG